MFIFGCCFILFTKNHSEPDMCLSPIFSLSTRTFNKCQRHRFKVLLDLLMSNETCFLEYLLLYVRRVGASRQSWTNLLDACAERDKRRYNHQKETNHAAPTSRTIIDVSELLIRLRFALERLASGGLFPYNPSPLIWRLEQVETIFTEWLTEQAT